jgi:hypothetical protein
MKRKPIDRSRQCGQAVVEFLVAASFVLVPLLFLVTYLGKIGDSQHRAYEGARYGTWEAARTGKGAVQIRHEIDRRILQHPYRPFDSVADGRPARSGELVLDPVYHHYDDQGGYQSLLGFQEGGYNQTTLAREEPDSKSMRARASIATAAPAKINVEKDGLTTAQIEFGLNSTRWLELTHFKQRAWKTMLTDSWRAVTRGAVEERLEHAILARQSFIDSPVFDMSTQVADTVGLEEWAGLEPGYIEHDVVPCSRVVGGEGDEDACL